MIEVGPDDVAAALIRTAREDDDPRVRATAADSLGKLGTDAAVPTLTEIAADYDEASSVREAAVRSLGSLDARDAVQVLGNLLEGYDCATTALQEEAAWALGEIGGEEAVRLLVVGLRTDAVGAVAESLRTVEPSETVIGYLTGCLREFEAEPPSVREVAAKLLGEIELRSRRSPQVRTLS